MTYNIPMNQSLRRALKIVFAICAAILVVLALLGYLYYRDLKKSLIQTLSAKSTALIGQPVEIGDLWISLSSGITLYNVSIKNPEGFPSGNLLRIKRIYLDTNYSELFSGKFYSRKITVTAPALTLSKDNNGRFNLSDKLRQFFQKKSTLTYRVDSLDLKSGSVDFNYDKRFSVDNIAVHLTDLSSSPGTKTMIKADTTYAGGRITFDGWVALKDEPKKFSVSISSEEISLTAFRELFSRYKMDTQKTKVMINAEIEGNTEDGLKLASELRLKNIGSEFINKEINDATLKTTAFLNLRANSLLIEDSSLASEGIVSAKFNAVIKDIRTKPSYQAEVMLNRLNLSAFRVSQDYSVRGTLTSKKILINSAVQKALPAVSGAFSAKGISIAGKDKRNLLKDAAFSSRLKFNEDAMDFHADMHAGKISIAASGSVKDIMDRKRSVRVGVNIPEVKLTDIRETFWDVFPDKLLYAGMEGSLSSRLSVDYSENSTKVNGSMAMSNISLQGENGEYSVGPINGTLPVYYSGPEKESRNREFPAFERSRFDSLQKLYAQNLRGNSYSQITIGSIGYGFPLFSDINLWIRQEGHVLNIARFNGNIFGGKMNGSAYVDISGGVRYRAGFILESLSLTKLCEGIQPIKGYISGKVDGVATVKGSGKGLSDLIGKADFWTFSTENEKTKISKEFLRKIGGPSLKTYLGDRSFDKGIVSMYLQNGYIIFDQMEISNRNFLGMQDLSVKVAPFNNRISIGHLLWTITEAAQRSKDQ